MRTGLQVLGLVVLAFALSRCGGDDICLNCNAGPTPTPGPRQLITLDGSVQDASPSILPLDDVIVIACFDLDPALTEPQAFNDCPAASRVDLDANRNFNLTNDLDVIGESSAATRIAFWLPQRSDGQPALTIQDGDYFGELTGEADQVQKLSDLRLGQTAQISPVFVSFALVEPGAAPGTATTSNINVFTTPNTTPTPSPDSTP